MISKSHEVDKSYNEIKTKFAEIRPEFIARLQQKAENKLTRLDLKYCSYILMELTNKEMASKLNVAPKSIRMARYRLKQKLNLQKDENLDKFINNLGSNKVK
ncbi:LuxR C-terminal-related transcriptional regulator [Galbibacter sp. EGI 63066]|uniref:helix-turn-helix transcriptional regulator n=1 Tax=Galbibacter sp. EGI 63066 TaxID=2993559 RepID=UPI0022494266|nr:LuxR C-terminal-related transcriptional regulator [Galbibacter sp. EGI 63066]MCX2679810.1 LuxR C-terminal-related transcriptional regulator [Galbibacter sp. EGI 63066]